MDRTADGRLVVAWTVAFLAGALAVASFRGVGTGPFGRAWMSHMIWSYAFVLAIVACVFVLISTGTPAPPGNRPTETHIHDE